MIPPPFGLANAAPSQREETPAASTICPITPTRCQARTRLYRDGKLELDGFPVADISEYLADKSVTIWLDLRNPDHEDLAVLSDPELLLASVARVLALPEEPGLELGQKRITARYSPFGISSAVNLASPKK